jgi:hypothetical protein
MTKKALPPFSRKRIFAKSGANPFKNNQSCCLVFLKEVAGFNLMFFC